MKQSLDRLRFNRWVFLLEGMNSLGTSYYFNYLFFYLKAQFGFSNLQNLLVCALNGFIYMGAAYYGGKFGQRRGYLNAMTLGPLIIIIGLVGSTFANSVPALMALMAFWTLGVCFTWPNLEAMVAEKMSANDLPKTIGIYNVVWAGCAGFSYFAGGAVAQALGWRSIFWVPLILHLVQLAIVQSLKARWNTLMTAPPVAGEGDLHESHPQGPLFLKLAWIANPFAYIAINAIIPLIPDLATRLHLSTAAAGFFCSIWFFARMFTFVVLALWPGWHYRMSYLFLSYVGMLACFAGILLFENFWLVLAFQLGFGWCIGLIYYSSLYYSMHVGDTKGEHGGFHEAALGVGIFGGPAIGALSLWLTPGFRQSGVIGVSIVLALGFGIISRARTIDRRR